MGLQLKTVFENKLFLKKTLYNFNTAMRF